MKTNATPPNNAAAHKINMIAMGRAMRAAIFVDKRRHHDPQYSRFVGTLKITLSAVALSLIALVASWPYLKSQQNRFRLGFTEIKLGKNEGPAMLNPRYVSADSDAQFYTITADLAKNISLKDTSVELEMPKASITLKDDTWLVLTSETGIYGREKKVLDLSGAVNLFHDSGYELRTEKAHLDLASGIASSEVPVEGQGQFGYLQSQGVIIYSNIKVINFTGKAKVTIYQGASAPQAGRK